MPVKEVPLVEDSGLPLRVSARGGQGLFSGSIVYSNLVMLYVGSFDIQQTINKST
jgi:hypothetical protein